jgi:hypothetical protein
MSYETNPFAPYTDEQLVAEVQAITEAYDGKPKGKAEWLVIELTNRLRRELGGGGTLVGKVTTDSEGIVVQLRPVA